MSPGPESKRLARVAALVLALAAIAISGWFTCSTMGTVMHRPGSDDGYYKRYMERVAEHGPAALPRLHRWWLEEDEGRHHIYPPPTRVGFIALTALWAKPFGASFDSLAHLSWVSFLWLALVHFAFARRHVGDLPAALATALLAFSPLLMGLSQRALTDTTNSLVQVLAMWLYYELVRAPRSWAKWLAFVATFTLAILIKEIVVLLALPFAAYAALERFHRRAPLPIGRTLLALALPPVVAIAVWVAAAGSVSTLVEVMRIVLLSPATNAPAIRFGSGPWFRYLIDEILVSPWPVLLALGALVGALWRWRRGEFDSLAIFFGLVIVLQLAALAPFTKNLRYVAALEAPLRLLAVVGLTAFVGKERAILARVAPVFAIAVVCCLDAATFRVLHLEQKIYDPVTQALAAGRHVIPGKPIQ